MQLLKLASFKCLTCCLRSSVHFDFTIFQFPCCLSGQRPIFAHNFPSIRCIHLLPDEVVIFRVFLEIVTLLFQACSVEARTEMNSQSSVTKNTSPRGRKRKENVQRGVSVNGKLFLGCNSKITSQITRDNLSLIKNKTEMQKSEKPQCQDSHTVTVAQRKGEKYDCTDSRFPIYIKHKHAVSMSDFHFLNSESYLLQTERDENSASKYVRVYLFLWKALTSLGSHGNSSFSSLISVMCNSFTAALLCGRRP